MEEVIISASDFPIVPTTKVAALLDRFPELEEVLIGMAPPFKKLKNPILRMSVAKVASLRQVAAVGRMPIGELVNKLRSAVGQEPIEVESTSAEAAYFTDRPDWFDRAKVVATLSEKEGDPDKMAITRILPKAQALQAGEILEFVTSFLPAPGIDVMKGKGFRVWSVQEGPSVRTYFSKPPSLAGLAAELRR